MRQSLDVGQWYKGQFGHDSSIKAVKLKIEGLMCNVVDWRSYERKYFL